MLPASLFDFCGVFEFGWVPGVVVIPVFADEVFDGVGFIVMVGVFTFLVDGDA